MKDYPKVVLTSNTARIDPARIPAHVTLNFGQVLLGAVQRAAQNPEFMAEYERWKAEKEKHHGKD